jgi:hypothetical protein
MKKLLCSFVGLSVLFVCSSSSGVTYNFPRGERSIIQDNVVVRKTFTLESNVTFQLPSVSVSNRVDIVSDGTTNGSQSSVVQTLMNLNQVNGGDVYFKPGDYWLTNIIVPSNTFLHGNGAILHMPRTSTGPMLACPTNATFKFLGIEGFVFDGGDSSRIWETNCANISWPITYFYSTLFGNTSWSNRVGLFVNGAGGGVVKNNLFRGWAGQGLFAINSAFDGIKSPTYTKFEFNHFEHNFIGFHPSAYSYEIPPFGAGKIWDVQYFPCIGNVFFQNSVGMVISSPNHNVNGNIFDGNWVAMVSGNANAHAAHGLIVGNTINHNTWSMVFEGTQFGEFVTGNMIQAGGDIYLDTCSAIVIAGNYIQTISVYQTNSIVAATSGTNIFANNYVAAITFNTNTPGGSYLLSTNNNVTWTTGF